jgi:hypothetical protein
VGLQSGDHPGGGRLERRRRRQPGIFRKGGYWYLSDDVDHPVGIRTFRYGMQAGDLPVVGDWNGDGVDGVGVFRRGVWYLNDALTSSATSRTISFGAARRPPGRRRLACPRSRQHRRLPAGAGKWYLRRSLNDASVITVTFGQKWLVG